MSEDKTIIGKAREGKFNGLRFRGWSSWRGSGERVPRPRAQGCLVVTRVEAAMTDDSVARSTVGIGVSVRLSLPYDLQ